MIEQEDRVLDPGEYDDLLRAYLEERARDFVVCRESVYDGKLCILLEIPLTPTLPHALSVFPREAALRVFQARRTRASSGNRD